MTTWKDHKERRTPFLSRGMGRTAYLEQRVEALEAIAANGGSLVFVRQLPAHPDPNITYVIYTDS